MKIFSQPMKSITNINKELQWIHLLDTQLDYEDTLMRSKN